MSDFAQQYWKQMTELKGHIYYLQHYAADLDWWDNTINIVLAVASNGSIAAWVVWKEWVYVWPVVIAISQLMTAVRPFFPFKQRQRMIMGLRDAFQIIFLDMEDDWCDVSRGQLTEQELHNHIKKYKCKINKAEQEHLKDHLLPKRPKGKIDEARKEADTYFRYYYETQEKSDDEQNPTS